MPRWRDYYLAHDQTSHYEYLETQLKAMQFLRGGRRWLLKSPQHLEQLPVLNNVFPGVFVIFTHRDPAPVVLSMLAMITYSARMYCSPVPVDEIAASWVDRLESMLNALVRDRDTIPPERSIDVRFDEFMADEMARRRAGVRPGRRSLDDEARTAITDYLAGHQRGRLGTRRDIARDVRPRRERPARAVRRRTSSASWRDVDQRSGQLDYLVEFANRRGAAVLPLPSPRLGGR